ncbi:putative methyltransferase DDB_G0268948 [Punica granatum]|uniref:Uncharacterized protein n=2 Tax=Punica granatum TaxID=22663 RepID=A0A2I0HLJ9_PUNGR|nr:putative methyltransferase DDB_G0268948 [Punica granatum]PKI32599.1 hypothetical protein CRG98_046996 [Punica granatum]
MADLFVKQAKQYAKTRPSYPAELFQFIASKAAFHGLAWDVGTGSGQAAQSLAEIYERVVATDTSPTQLGFAPKLPNVRYELTSPVMSWTELEKKIAPESSLDLVTIAQALHWFDLPTFYQQVKWALKKPNGLIAAWCYTVPEVNGLVDSVFRPFYADSDPFWDPARKLVDNEYRGIDFPFEPVEGADSTGPFRFVSERAMTLTEYFTYIRSWSAYQTAKGEGVELLSSNVIEKFERAWNEDGNSPKIVKFPVYLRIGRTGN